VGGGQFGRDRVEHDPATELARGDKARRVRLSACRHGMKVKVNAGMQPQHVGHLLIEEAVVPAENICEKLGEVRS
jgi:hypothetical protein